jgi:uncharacterized protein
MVARSATAPFWFAAALVPMVAAQLLRLQQTDPAAWLFWDYAGRIAALTVLVAIPSARTIAFQHEELRPSHWEGALKIIVIVVLLDSCLGPWVGRTINAAHPGTALGAYPASTGWLRAFDLCAGLALVAYHEEIVFRRGARSLFRAWLGDGCAMIVVTSLLFAAYHWWTGIGNICVVFLAGTALMLAYRFLGALWPVVLIHYLMDLRAFL